MQSLERFVREFGKMPSKKDMKEVDYLLSYSTIVRVVGNIRDLGLVEKVYNENPKLCKQCGKKIEFCKRNIKNFCSLSCSASFNRRGKIRKNKNTVLMCANCGKTTHRSGRKYCCCECQHEFEYTNRKNDWINNGTKLSNRVLYNFLCDIDGCKCSECGITEYNGKELRLEVDHIDGNSEDCSYSNVRLLCPNCHSQTPTYKSKNRGNGRELRRKRVM